jgi:ATP phosphoribosyltransferase
MNPPPTVRLSLPSKGRLAEDSLEFLASCGLEVDKPNPRQYEARLPLLPDLVVLFQRPGDIVVSVRDGSVDFGITGIDVIEERRGGNGDLLVLHDALGFGHCYLALAVPEAWESVQSTADLARQTADLGRPLNVATKYPVLTARFLDDSGIPYRLISAEGTLETAPAIGYADLIADLVSSGQTLRDNRLRALPDGVIQPSQAALIANRKALLERPQALTIARYLLEYIEAHLRAVGNVAIFANIRGESPAHIARRIFAQETIGGLQGPTISPVVVRDGDPNWFAVHIVIRRDRLFKAIAELRSIGGSGVVVTPVTYIFEEEPPRFKAMLAALEKTYVPNP